VSVLLLLVAFRNLGWDTRGFFERLARAEGVVVGSTYWDTVCGKSGPCRDLYETRVDFRDQAGSGRTFETHWAVKYAAGESVIVEYAPARPSLARIERTSDQSTTLVGFVTGFAGLGVPLSVGALVVSLDELSRFFRRTGPPRVVPAPRLLAYCAAALAALTAEAMVAIYFYWL
jgi:hypothetical protein